MRKDPNEADLALAAFFEARRDTGASVMREAAWERFQQYGLPNRRVESWHWTDLRAALSKPAPLAAPGAAIVADKTHDAVRLVLVDGVFRPDLSDTGRLPKDVRAQSLRDALAQGDAATMAMLAPENLGVGDAAVALNAALMSDGVILRVAPGVQIPRPVEIACFSSGGSSFTRSLAVVGQGAKVTILATYGATPTPAQTNSVLLLSLGSDAVVEHVAPFGAASEDCVRVVSLLATLERGSTLNSTALIEGGGLLRRQVFARLMGEHAKVSFSGASLLRGRCHADTTLVVEHAAPNGTSRERFRYIVDEQATGVFQGKAVVRPGAQKTDGSMQSKALLLSDMATMNNKPELEIFADDVVCGHGATTGRLDRDQLFYLTARGIPKDEAEALLIEGFANEALDGIEDLGLRATLSGRVSAWLAARKGA